MRGCLSLRSPQRSTCSLAAHVNEHLRTMRGRWQVSWIKFCDTCLPAVKHHCAAGRQPNTGGRELRQWPGLACTTPGSARVDVSPSSSSLLAAILRRMRRMILPAGQCRATQTDLCVLRQPPQACAMATEQSGLAERAAVCVGLAAGCNSWRGGQDGHVPPATASSAHQTASWAGRAPSG